MPTEQSYDVVVIGAGPPGENAAARAVRGGLSAVLVESELLGGECSFWACMPSKALLRPGTALAAARAVAGSREAATGTLDAAAVLARRDSFTSNWDDKGQVEWAHGAGVDVLRGKGRLTGERRVVVDGPDGTTELTARHAVVLATGTLAAIPPIDGLAEARPWTSREGTSAKSVPRRLAVLGGGVVACELATAWRRLGAEQVVMLIRGQRLLPTTEPFAGELVRASLEDMGVEVRRGVQARAVRREDAGGVTLDLDDGSKLEVDELLVAAGRKPNTGDLGLAAVGLADGGPVRTDDAMCAVGVEGRWLYAVGDITGRALLTHMGKYQARIAGDVIAARAAGKAGSRSPAPWSAWSATADHNAVPQVVFTDPEVAAVGRTEAAAREQGLAVDVRELDVGRVAGASLYADGYPGRAKLVVDTDRGVVVGATFVGPDMAELIHSATIAVVGEVPLARLWHAVPSFPTTSELWLKLLEAFDL